MKKLENKLTDNPDLATDLRAYHILLNLLYLELESNTDFTNGTKDLWLELINTIGVSLNEWSREIRRFV